ncbi:hypothetical protein BX616_000934 [Lobosporangium transversale]|nr:hypothetical protein BX616_000934 [Lobosporangium transversale]
MAIVFTKLQSNTCFQRYMIINSLTNCSTEETFKTVSASQCFFTVVLLSRFPKKHEKFTAPLSARFWVRFLGAPLPGANIEKIKFKAYESFSEEYGPLQRLRSIAYEVEYTWPIPVHLYNQIKLHSSIITSFYLDERIWNLPEIWKALLECTNFKHLKLDHKYIRAEANLFLQVCKKVRHLELKRVAIYQLPINFLNIEDSNCIFPNIRTLSIEKVNTLSPRGPYTSPCCVSMLDRRCPELSSLHINGQELDDDRGFFRVAFLQNPWTLNSLSDLTFLHTQVKDEDIAALLRRMTGMRRLGGYRSGDAQTILSNCPRLGSLTDLKVTVTEVVDEVEWVCAGLTTLYIYFAADIDQETEEGMAKSRIVFRQLGKLTQLEYLGLTSWWGTEDGGGRTLDLRLRAGLDELANLKRLRTLSFGNSLPQRTQLEDAT